MAEKCVYVRPRGDLQGAGLIRLESEPDVGLGQSNETLNSCILKY